MTINLVKIFEPVGRYRTMLYVPKSMEVEFALRSYDFWDSWIMYDIRNKRLLRVSRIQPDGQNQITDDKGGEEDCKKFDEFMKKYFIDDSARGPLFMCAYEIQFSGKDYVSRDELFHEKWKIGEDQICDDIFITGELIMYRDISSLRNRKSFCILAPAHSTKEDLEESVRAWAKDGFDIEDKVVENFHRFLVKKRLLGI